MAAYSVQLSWLLLFSGLFYLLFIVFVLPGLARSLKFRYYFSKTIAQSLVEKTVVGFSETNEHVFALLDELSINAEIMFCEIQCFFFLWYR